MLDNPRQFGDPRLHGNGFIQLDLAEDVRLHVWADYLPRQEVDTQIHDHRFSFDSTVLLGTLIHTVYDLVPGDSYRLYLATLRKGQDTELVLLDGGSVGFNLNAEYRIKAGESYSFQALKFHSTGHQGITATIMCKTETVNHVPMAACPVGLEPDNKFNRYSFSTEQLWKTIEHAVHLF